jgi:hypothetical protein
VEWSFDIETEFFVELTLSWLSFPLVSVDNVPLLIESSMLFVDHDVSVFSVNVTLDI